MSHVDLHAHLLPGIDDGAATLQETVAFARRLDAEGVHDVACTSHVKSRDFPNARLEAFAALRADAQRAIDAAGLTVRLHPGGELGHEDALELSPESLALIAQGPEHNPFLLLESPFEGIDGEFLAAVRRLRELGYGLLLAHPERSWGLLDRGGLHALRPLLADGVRLQVNVSSLLGAHGRREREAAESLVRGGLAHCLASDAHPGTREHTLAEGVAHLRAEGWSTARVLRLTQAHPAALLRDGVPGAQPGVLAAA